MLSENLRLEPDYMDRKRACMALYVERRSEVDRQVALHNAQRQIEIREKNQKYIEADNWKKQEIARQRREAEELGNYYIEAEPKVLLAVRIRGILDIKCTIETTMKMLKVNRANSASFVLANKVGYGMLHKARDYIAYGYPSKELIREMIYRHGTIVVDNNAVRLDSDALVEQEFAGINPKNPIISVEDIVQEIASGGPCFMPVNRRLRAIRLNTPNGGWKCFKKKSTQFVEGGAAGNRENLIDDLVYRML